MKALPILLVLSFTFACQQNTSVDLEREKIALLNIHRTDREAHFETDVEKLLSHSDKNEFITVSSGRIDKVSVEQSRQFFESYFRNAKYFEWDDLEEPIVRISRDGSMAWMIVRTKVRRIQIDENGKEQTRQFIYAGIMTYEKKKEKWIRVANVSTFESG
jgi:hypothetical protein